eukprot:gb/GECH01000584.1/.p1 GENE.gb/GECH01000584.1/~~gb/GECH01000584.1/.p1  ORF type:complete len:410 (+),score=88.69 gb/GECH01000584.1/:1-1230(+)
MSSSNENTPAAIFLSIAAGSLTGTSIIGIRIAAGLLRKKTLWKFENYWLYHSLLFLLPWPVLAALITSPSQLRDLYTAIDASDVTASVIMFGVWSILGFFARGFSTHYAGVGNAAVLVYGIAMVAFPVWDLGINEETRDIWTNSDSRIAAHVIGLGVLLFGLLILGIASIRRHIKVKRKMEDAETHIEKDVEKDRERFNAGFKAERVNATVRYIIGIIGGVIAGAALPYIYADDLSRFVVKASNVGIGPVKAKLAVLPILMSPVSIVLNIIGVIVMLLINKSYKKFAIASGGMICFDGGTNFRGYRLLMMLVAFIGSLLGFVGVGLYILAQDYVADPIVDKYPFYIVMGTAFLISNLWGVVLMEWRKRRLLLLEEIVFVIGTIVVVVGAAVLAVGNNTSLPVNNDDNNN